MYLMKYAPNEDSYLSLRYPPDGTQDSCLSSKRLANTGQNVRIWVGSAHQLEGTFLSLFGNASFKNLNNSSSKH